MTGPELIALMRRHKITIRALAQRMDIPLARVRQVRQHGLTCPLAVRDWLEAVTGTDPGPQEGPMRLPQGGRTDKEITHVVVLHPHLDPGPRRPGDH
jgi:hypothetical protein